MILLPIPKMCEYKEETFLIPDNLRITCKSEKTKKYISQFLGDFKLVEDSSDITFKICKDLKNEEHIINISSEGIDVVGGSEEALFRASATLKQIILQSDNGEIPALTISDEPDFENRGIMLDVSRGRIQKPETIKLIINIMADMKYNELQLYFDKIVFEYKSMSSYYCKENVLTVEDIKSIQKYCEERFIEFVPNQNSLGHMQGWIAQEEFKHLGIDRDDNKPSTTINPLEEESLQLVDRLYGDLLPVFASDKVNIGMDEPWELGMGQTKEACETIGAGRIYTDYLKKVCSLASGKYGKRPMFWDDIIMKHPEYIDELPKDCIVVDWGYEADSKFEKRCIRLKDSGLEYYVAPGTSNWESVTGRGMNMLYNIQVAANSGATWGAKGFLLTDWCDEGGVMPVCMSYIPYAVGAAYSWNSGCNGEEFESNVDECIQNVYRSKILETARKYVDKFILKNYGKSFAHIMYKLSKTYLLEPNGVYNETQLSRLARVDISDTELEGVIPQYFEEIEEYILKLKKESNECLLNCEDGELIKQEFEVLCDIAIYLARAIQICAGEYNGIEYSTMLPELTHLKTRFEKVWCERNIDVGYQNFESRLEGVIEKIDRIRQSGTNI